LSKYPPLPESPTNRPKIKTNNQNLEMDINLQKERLMPLGRRLLKVRNRTAINIILGRERQTPKLNTEGYLKGAFTLNNNVGYKPERVKL
jgi:hypothetical protein